jgi:hypothetical protein
MATFLVWLPDFNALLVSGGAELELVDDDDDDHLSFGNRIFRIVDSCLGLCKAGRCCCCCRWLDDCFACMPCPVASLSARLCSDNNNDIMIIHRLFIIATTIVVDMSRYRRYVPTLSLCVCPK